MHGAGLYLYDQHYGFYANTSQLEATNALWQSIQTTSLQVQTFNMSAAEFKKSKDGTSAAGAVGADNADQPEPEPLSRTSRSRWGGRYSMEPEIAIFTDDESPLYWRLSSGAHHGTEDQVPDPGVHWPGSDPLSWNQLLLIDPVLALGNLGAPVRHYTLNDLLLPPCPDAGAERRARHGDQTQSQTAAAGAGCIPLRHLRLAIFTQAHALSDALTNAVYSKLAINNVTLTFLYAAGVVNRSTGVGLGEAGFQHATGIASLRGGTGGPMPLNVTLEPGGADGKVSGSFGPEISIEPWYYIAEDDDGGGNEGGAYQKPKPQMTVLARFAAARPSTRPASSPTPRSPRSKSSSPSEPRPRTSPWLVAIARIQMPTHNVVFSATPSVPTPVWREIAENAGVHLYATASSRVQRGAGRAAAATPRVGDVGIVGTDAIVEVAGSTSLYVAFANGVHWNPWSQRHLKVDRGDAANRVCSVQLKGAVQSVRRYLDASMIANSRGVHPERSNNSPSTVLVCEECSTWQQPCNTSVLYVLGAST